MAHTANPNEKAEGGRMSAASWRTLHPMAHMATLINANQAEETTVSRKCTIIILNTVRRRQSLPKLLYLG
jgi:hypothetical protein